MLDGATTCVPAQSPMERNRQTVRSQDTVASGGETACLSNVGDARDRDPRQAHVCPAESWSPGRRAHGGR
ncbi:MAG: hypothetical protein ACFFBV_13170 [Promethearchaeota archaeon]